MSSSEVSLKIDNEDLNNNLDSAKKHAFGAFEYFLDIMDKINLSV